MPVAVGKAVGVREALRGAVIMGLWDMGDELRIYLSKHGRPLTLVVRADLDCQYWDGDYCVDEDAASIVEYEVVGDGLR